MFYGLAYMVYSIEKTLHTWEQCVLQVALGWSILQVFVSSNWFKVLVLLKSAIFLCIICLVFLFIIKSGMVKSPTVIGEFSISPFILCLFHIFCASVIRCISVYNNYVFFISLSSDHYKKSSFASSRNFCLRVYCVWY